MSCQGLFDRRTKGAADSLILANGRALARDFGAPPILLLDEVAAHLDATAARRCMMKSARLARRLG